MNTSTLNLFDKEGYTSLHCAIEASPNDDYDNLKILLNDEKGKSGHKKSIYT